MYDILFYIWLQFMANVGKYSLRGASEISYCPPGIDRSGSEISSTVPATAAAPGQLPRQVRAETQQLWRGLDAEITERYFDEGVCDTMGVSLKIYIIWKNHRKSTKQNDFPRKR